MSAASATNVGVKLMRPTPRKLDAPTFWIIAGPNGSGKSSLYNRTDIEGWGGSVWIINPDLLTQSIVERERLPLHNANLAAVQRIERWLDSSIDVYQTIGVETVLSSAKYRRLVKRAQAAGYVIRMLYVFLDTADRQIERVRLRVSEGGHDVPTDAIIARRQRSFEQLCWFSYHCDSCTLYDNSTGVPELAAEFADGTMYRLADLPHDMQQVFDVGFDCNDDIADLE